MNPLLFIMPVLAVYLVFRAVMHKRTGRVKWFAHYLIMAGFILCIFFFELWMSLRGTP